MSLERVVNMTVALHCFPLHRSGPICHADQHGLFSGMHAMNKFATNPLDDAVFWQSRRD